MLRLKLIGGAVLVAASGGFLLALLLCGCQSSSAPATTQTAAAPAATAEPPNFALFGPPPQRTGVQLWSENCARCHNMRPPNEFSEAQWATIVHHMRLRANLTGDEERKITEFLKSSS